MTLVRKISRQLWQAKNVGLSHVTAKVFRRLIGKQGPSSASEAALRIHATRLTERTVKLEDSFHRLGNEVRQAFNDGRFSDYLRFGGEAGEVRDALASEWGLDPAGTRIIGSSFLGPFGHLALFDLFVKAQNLGKFGTARFEVLAEANRIPNNAYFNLWRPFFETRLITSREWADVDLLKWPICERADFIRTNDGYKNSMNLWDEVDREWESSGRSSLLELPSEVSERGSKILKKFGLDENQWFVCLHVREGDHRLSYKGPNADISTYELAMQEIVRRGGVVIRMGNPDMQPIIERPGVIDYAHSVRRADWLDVYLWANCRFFVGTGSGPIHVPGTFGVPVLMTNTSAVGMFPSYSPGSMMITKHFIDSKSNQEVSLEEALRRGAGWNWSADLVKHGLELRDNSPEEILDAVKDMFEGGASELTQNQRELANRRKDMGSAISTPFAPSFADRMNSL